MPLSCELSPYISVLEGRVFGWLNNKWGVYSENVPETLLMLQWCKLIVFRAYGFLKSKLCIVSEVHNWFSDQ